MFFRTTYKTKDREVLAIIKINKKRMRNLIYFLNKHKIDLLEFFQYEEYLLGMLELFILDFEKMPLNGDVEILEYELVNEWE